MGTHRTPSRGRRSGWLPVAVGWLACAAVTAATAGAAGAGEPPANPAAALATFSKAYDRARTGTERIHAVEALGRLEDEKIAQRLLQVLRTTSDEEVAQAALIALRTQQSSAAKVAAKLAVRLVADAAEAQARLAKGDGGFRVDPRTGNADTTSPEGRERLELARQKAATHLALLETLTALAWEPKGAPPDLSPFLQDASDALVVAALARIEAWHAKEALPAILGLFRMYPGEYLWETGAVVDLAGTNASAKAKWMLLFGHPDKQKARPAVVVAIRRTVKGLTGRALDTPEALAGYLGEGSAATARTRKEMKGR